jgi:hypothetical protein
MKRRFSILVRELGSKHEVELVQCDTRPEAIVAALHAKTVHQSVMGRGHRITQYCEIRVVDNTGETPDALHIQPAKLKSWRCEDCGRGSRNAAPMLHDDVWSTIATKYTALCFDCTETRLGRQLKKEDLTDCIFNAGWIEFDTSDPESRLYAVGRSLLHSQVAP